MDQYVIKGGIPLVGEVEIGGAKNAALAILAAAIMTDETVTVENLPNVRDTNVLLQAMEEIGARVERLDYHTVKINSSGPGIFPTEYSLSLYSTLNGKKSIPSLGFSEAVAVQSTVVSP